MIASSGEDFIRHRDGLEAEILANICPEDRRMDMIQVIDGCVVLPVRSAV
jgi:hypothetical protein